MKKIKSSYIRFVYTVGTSLALSIVITISIALLLGFQSVKDVKITIPKEKNVLVVGNSMSQCALNDSILHNWMNISQSNLYLCEITNVVDSILRQNQHIDTLILSMGVATITVFPDDYYCGRATAEVKKFAHNIFLDKNLVWQNMKNLRFIRLLLENAPDTYLLSEPKLYGNFILKEDHKLPLDIKWRHYLKKNDLAYFKCDDNNFNLQYQATKDIINICKKYNVKLILFDGPQYRLSDLWEDEDYRKFLGTLDPDIPYADYVNFEFPDTTYYRDVVHTNYLGANYLSKDIKNNGLKTVPLCEYLNNRNQTSNSHYIR